MTTYGYIFLFIYSLGGGFIGLIVAGVFASVGKMDITVVIFTAFIANFLGDNLLVYVARYQKSDFLNFITKHRRKLALCRIWIHRYDTWVIFIQKFIYGIKTLIPLVIGFSNYNFKKFIVLNFFASLVFALTLGLLSYNIGNYLLELSSQFEDMEYLPPLILAGILGLFFLILSKMTEKSIGKTKK